MTHEFKKIVQAYEFAAANGLKAVLATVVALEGSSYRRPGVRMLITDDHKMTGAVSGGCVEKEVLRQSIPVFGASAARIMTYDGRYRLGCEGILYILLEPFEPDAEFLEIFGETIKERGLFEIESHYFQGESSSAHYGSMLKLKGRKYPFRPSFQSNPEDAVFTEQLKPCSKLLILGAEHDAVQLCSFASLMGWEVTVVANASEEKTLADFPGAQELLCVMPESYHPDTIDTQTAVVLMTHSFVKDLQFLISLKDTTPAYLGLLGPAKRRERLLHEFLERCPDPTDTFFKNLHGPAGLNVGAETPQEIAIAILSEILAVTHGQDPIPLRDKKGAIHN